MPRPPFEADGSPAWNCRCHLSPILAPVQSILDDPTKRAVFTNAHQKLIPDPSTYDEWFNRADVKHRRLAVGARRYETVRSQLRQGEPIAWDLFVDPKDGSLLSIDYLEQEGFWDRAERRAKVQNLINSRRAAIRHVSTFGFLAPSI